VSGHKKPHPKKQAFLGTLAEVGNISQAAELVGINRSAHYDWMRDDPDYPALYEAAMEQAADRLEQEARRRAVEGVEDPIYYQGKKVGTVKKYSDSLLIFLLKGARPGKYAERFDQRISGPGGGPLQIVLSELDREVFGGGEGTD
jgi:hypothetical protein